MGVYLLTQMEITTQEPGARGEDCEQHEAQDQCQRLQTHEPQGSPVCHLLPVAAFSRGCAEHDSGAPAKPIAAGRGESGETHVQTLTSLPVSASQDPAAQGR